MSRRQNFQTIAWFWDLHERGRLNLDPPYQRRSVWNMRYKLEFIETILLGYPAPAIFLYEEIESTGVTRYNVVDGKQRLTTLFEFIKGRFAVAEESPVVQARGKYFAQIEPKTPFWSYPFSVEYLPTTDETLINDMFHRINKNVAKLTAQELRHARFSGIFIGASEGLGEWMLSELGEFPRIVTQSRRQMKDVEMVAQLLLLIEKGEPRGHSQDDLDSAFSERDETWDDHARVDAEFRATVSYIKQMLAAPLGDALRTSRLRNQLDFYSLFGAIHAAARTDTLPTPSDGAQALVQFALAVDNEDQRKNNPRAQQYYEAARSAANDTGQRKARVDTLVAVLSAQ